MLLNKKIFENHDWTITLISVILIIFGVIVVYGTTFNSTTLEEGQGIIIKQIILVIIGFVAYTILSLLDYRWFQEPKVLIILYIITILALIIVGFFSPEISGTHRWIMIGSFAIQPAEYAKIILILTTAGIFSLKESRVGKYKIKKINSENMTLIERIQQKNVDISRILQSSLFIFPFFFLILIEPSFGNSIITLMIWGLMCLIFYRDKSKLFALIISLFSGFLISWTILNSNLNFFLILKLLVSIGGIIGLYFILKPKLSEILMFLIIGILVVPIGKYTWEYVLKDYQRTRVETFLNPEKDPSGAGWQVRQSKIAIGSGRIFGKGFMKGTQGSLKILPFAHTDFVFASLSEQFGFIGALSLLFLFFVLLIKIFFYADNLNDPFAKFTTYGIGFMILVQVVVNIGINLGKLPVTGIPLPLVSYGGNSVLITMISLGLIQSMIKYNKKQI